MHTTKSVRYHLTTDKKFVLNCLMILNARQSGFLPQDVEQLKRIATKVKKRKKLMPRDWSEARDRLAKYAQILAAAINDINQKKTSLPLNR